MVQFAYEDAKALKVSIPEHAIHTAYTDMFCIHIYVYI